MGDTYTAYYSGYFKAPISGDYQFLAYGDDRVFFEFNGTNVSSSTTYDSYGQFFANQDPANQIWLTLVEGTYYKYKIYHQEYTGNDFMRTSV